MLDHFAELEIRGKAEIEKTTIWLKKKNPAGKKGGRFRNGKDLHYKKIAEGERGSGKMKERGAQRLNSPVINLPEKSWRGSEGGNFTKKWGQEGYLSENV